MSDPFSFSIVAKKKRKKPHAHLKIRFRVYATPNQQESVRYALDIGANITDYFEDYFEVRNTVVSG